MKKDEAPKITDQAFGIFKAFRPDMAFLEIAVLLNGGSLNDGYIT